MKKQVDFLPMTLEETRARGWDEVDVVFVTGDAYVDHPSFAMALLGRVLERAGYRVALLSQPDWKSAEPWKLFGRPRLCYAISAGNMDSMLNRYTAGRKVRNADAYSPGGRINLRPERATIVYSQRAREAFHGVPILIGGIEASLRRVAHYDYWSDKVRRSILCESKADLLVYGMGEKPLLTILSRLNQGEKIGAIRDLRGTAFRLGAKESAALESFEGKELPDYESVVKDKSQFVRMTKILHDEMNPHLAQSLLQRHGNEAVVVNPPSFPLSTEELDGYYNLPFLRRPHPSYGREAIPAWEVIRNSIQISRGCFGGCAFCSIAAHEGRSVQSRSQDSIIQEIKGLAEEKFSGTISDLGGPTANMYALGCSDPEAEKKCRRGSCLFPAVCPKLNVDHDPLLKLLRAARNLPGVQKVLITSGIRMDLAEHSPDYIEEIAEHHTGGRLKVAPEHLVTSVLKCMRKPADDSYANFSRRFDQASRRAGKKQSLVPYFIAGHPGCDVNDMIELALLLKREGIEADKAQEFIPLPMAVSTCMYYTGIDPIRNIEVYVPRGTIERRRQKALLHYHLPENYFLVREALLEAGRGDLIGSGKNCLIADRPPHTRDRNSLKRNQRTGGFEQKPIAHEKKNSFRSPSSTPGPQGDTLKKEQKSRRGYRPYNKRKK